jgi:hypothetical protein
MAADPITLPARRLTVPALLEAAERSGLSDEQIDRLIHALLADVLLPPEPTIRRAGTSGAADRRLLRAVWEVDGG